MRAMTLIMFSMLPKCPYPGFERFTVHRGDQPAAPRPTGGEEGITSTACEAASRVVAGLENRRSTVDTVGRRQDRRPEAAGLFPALRWPAFAFGWPDPGRSMARGWPTLALRWPVLAFRSHGLEACLLVFTGFLENRPLGPPKKGQWANSDSPARRSRELALPEQSHRLTMRK